MVFETKKNDLLDENDLKSLNNFFEVPENFVQKIKIQEGKHCALRETLFNKKLVFIVICVSIDNAWIVMII